MIGKKYKLYELKEGDKFYYDDLIYVLKSCEYDPSNPDHIRVRLKRYKIDRLWEEMQMHGTGVAEREYYKYTRRDVNSFLAGFRSAIAICEPHMDVFDKENAGINGEIEKHLLALKSLKKWEKNQIKK
jgi:hypothetical protein